MNHELELVAELNSRRLALRALRKDARTRKYGRTRTSKGGDRLKPRIVWVERRRSEFIITFIHLPQASSADTILIINPAPY